jgi:hypothetical protein
VQEEDGGDEEESTTGMGIVRIPFPMVAGGPSSVIRVSRPKDHIFDEEWVAFFSGIINMQLPDGTAAEGSAKPKPAARRIVLLESTAAMAETLDIWYPSLLEAVRRRRRGPSATRPKARASAPKLTQPTTIVLSVPPSLLLSHTADVRPPPTEGAEGNEGADSFKDRLRTVAEVLGAAPETPDKHEEQLWWSSEEHDRDGRARRDERRLRALLDHGWVTVMLGFY